MENVETARISGGETPSSVFASLLVALAGSGLAFAVTRLAGFTSGIDAALPFWVLLAALAGAIAISERASQWIALAIPVLLGAAIAIPYDRAAHLVYGLVLAAALAIALFDIARGGEVPRGRAIALAMLVVATRAFPFEASAVVPLLFLGLGTATLIVAASMRNGARPSRPPEIAGHPEDAKRPEDLKMRESRFPHFEIPRFARDDSNERFFRYPESSDGSSRGTFDLLPLLLVLAIALVTPLAPGNAALVPLALGLAFFAARESARPQAASTVIFTIAALGLGLLIGKWMAAAVAIVVAAGAVRIYGGTAHALRRYVHLAAAGLIAALAFFARPHPAVILLLMAFLVFAWRQRARDAAAVPGALLFCAVALSAWSGAAAASFPLFADRALWVPFALAAGVATLLVFLPLGRPGRPHHTIAASAIAGAAFVAFILVLPKEPRHVQPVLRAIEAGESFVLEPPPGSAAIDVVISGANISGIDEGAVLGRLDVADAAGRAYARPIRSGDIADWGAFRSGDLFRTRNPLPRSPGWTLEGEGREAALRGEGRLRVRLERPIGWIVVNADAALPAGARLQIERMEVAPE